MKIIGKRMNRIEQIKEKGDIMDRQREFDRRGRCCHVLSALRTTIVHNIARYTQNL
jgi:hypothetical protein